MKRKKSTKAAKMTLQVQ